MSIFARFRKFFELTKFSSCTKVHVPLIKTRIKALLTLCFVIASAICASEWTHLVWVLPSSNRWNTLSMSSTEYFSFRPSPEVFWGPFFITSKRDLASVTITPGTFCNNSPGFLNGISCPIISADWILTYMSSSSAMLNACISAERELLETRGSRPLFQLTMLIGQGLPSKIDGSVAAMT